MTEKEPIIPEVLDETDSEGKDKNLPQSQENRHLATTLSRFSMLPFYNKIREIGLRSWRKVIREETGLMEDLTGHARTIGELVDVEIDIEADHLERLNRLREAKREDKLSSQKDKIAELKAEIKKVELEGRLAEIEGKKSKKPPLEEQLAEEAKREAIKAEGYVNIEIAKKTAVSRVKQKSINSLKEEIRKIKKDSALSTMEKDEEIQELERRIGVIVTNI